MNSYIDNETIETFLFGGDWRYSDEWGLETCNNADLRGKAQDSVRDWRDVYRGEEDAYGNKIDVRIQDVYDVLYNARDEVRQDMARVLTMWDDGMDAVAISRKIFHNLAWWGGGRFVERVIRAHRDPYLEIDWASYRKRRRTF